MKQRAQGDLHLPHSHPRPWDQVYRIWQRSHRLSVLTWKDCPHQSFDGTVVVGKIFSEWKPSSLVGIGTVTWEHHLPPTSDCPVPRAHWRRSLAASVSAS